MPTSYVNPNRTFNETVTGPSTTPTPIGVAEAQQPQVPYTVPQAPAPNPQEYLGAIQSIDSILGQNNVPSAAEATQTTLRDTLLSTLERLGRKKQAQADAEAKAGLPGMNQQLTDVVGQLQSLQKEALAIPLQLQQDAEGRGVTQSGLAPIETGKLRQNAIKFLSFSAIAQTLQGNISLAQQQANRAVEIEFEPLEIRLSVLSKVYEMNREDIQREDNKRAQKIEAQLQERSRLLAEAKSDREAVNKAAGLAAQYGAPSDIINKVLQAKDYASALQAMGTYAQDPKLKLEMQKLDLDMKLTRAEIAYKNKQTQLLGEPSDAERKAMAASLKEAQSAIPVMHDKIAVVDVLKKHPGLNSRVGSTGLSRAPRTALGTVVRATSLIGLPSVVSGLQDSLTGAGQDFAGGVHKLVGGLTLDNLIAAKARGATFGALSEGELGMLANSASALNDWEIKDSNGKGTGYWNIDEASFNRELDNVRMLTQRALQLSGQSLYSNDEEALLQQLAQPAAGSINPGSSYY